MHDSEGTTCYGFRPESGGIGCLWKHIPSLPKDVGKVRGARAEARGDVLRVFFRVFSGGRLRRFVAEIDRSAGSIVTYGDKVEEVVQQVLEEARRVRPSSLKEFIAVFVNGIQSIYHDELAEIDALVENIVPKLMKGEKGMDDFTRIYHRLRNLHRAVHDLIFFAERSEGFLSLGTVLSSGPTYFEGMVSTTLDRFMDLFMLYYTVVGEKTNRVVTRLTVISSIFLPLTLIASIYGMNFRYMPELYVPWAYPAVLAGMLAIAVAQVIYFRRKGWL